MDKEDDLMLHEMHFENGALDMKLSGDSAKAFMYILIEFFKQNGGQDFLTLTMADKENKYAINIQNCNGTDTPAEKMAREEQIAKEYQDVAVELARIIQRLEREKVDLTVDDIKAVWKLKMLIGYSNPVSVEEGTGSSIDVFNRNSK